MNTMRSFFSRLCKSHILHRTVMAAVMMALAWNSLAFGGEIHDASRAGDLGKVKALLKENPDLVNSKDDSGQTPLHYAVHYGQKAVAEFLLANKANVNARTSKGVTALHLAAQQGNKEMVELLLAHKADVNAKTTIGWTPLYLAAQNGHKDVAALLLQNGGHE